jgi:hypothetical protein
VAHSTRAMGGVGGRYALPVSLAEGRACEAVPGPLRDDPPGLVRAMAAPKGLGDVRPDVSTCVCGCGFWRFWLLIVSNKCGAEAS